MKKIFLPLSIIYFFVNTISLGQQEKIVKPIIKFRNDIVIRNNDSLSTVDLDNLNKLYIQLYKNNFVENPNSKTHVSNVISFLNNIRLDNKKFSLLFEPQNIEKFYVKVNDRFNNIENSNIDLKKTFCIPDVLQNVFYIDTCIRQEDCLVLAQKFNKNFEPFSELKCSSITNNDLRPREDDITNNPNSSYFNYRQKMRIDSLNFLGINGKNANLVIIEKSLPIKNHPNLIPSRELFDLSRRVMMGGVVDSKIHATQTAGIIFSKPKGNYKLTGVSNEAILKKTILFGTKVCRTVEYEKNDYFNAILSGITNAGEGDILLIEFSLEDGPVENDAIINNLFGIATNCFGTTIIEPIGNCSNKSCSLDKLKFEEFTPCNYNGILVGGAIESFRNKYVFDSTVIYSIKHLTCFGFSKNLQTTTVNNEYTNFGGSSGASAIIAGLAACMQGYYFNKKDKKYLNVKYLTNAQIKEALRYAKGLPVSGFQQKIPNAMELIKYIDNNF